MPNDLQIQALLTALSIQRGEHDSTFDEAWEAAEAQGLVVDGLEEARTGLKWEYEHPRIPIMPHPLMTDA